MRAFVLATGPSMTPEQAEAVQGRGLVVAVSNAYKLAPWADALVSTDAIWWYENPDARAFRGTKVSAAPVEGIERFPDVPVDINSGLLALKFAVAAGATSVVLLGIDLHGSHYFGDHAPPLVNSQPWHFEAMRRNFAAYQPAGVEIVNCAPGSMLDAYPRRDLSEVL